MTELELDEIITVHWGSVLRRVMTDGDDWSKGFVRSIARHAKRPTWRPTPKQAALMRRFVTELGTAPEKEIEVIER